jgi:hypothetical protein
VFLVILVYFNIRNTLPKFGTFLLGQPVYLGSFFLDPEDIRKLSIRAIWNFVKETGLL